MVREGAALIPDTERDHVDCPAGGKIHVCLIKVFEPDAGSRRQSRFRCRAARGHARYLLPPRLADNLVGCVTQRAIRAGAEKSQLAQTCGVALYAQQNARYRKKPDSKAAPAREQGSERALAAIFGLPHMFDPAAHHLIRVVSG